MHLSFDSLPDEILLEIFSYCKAENLVLNISKVCERWERLCKDKKLWQDLVLHMTPWLISKTGEIIKSCCHLQSLTLYSDVEHVAEHLHLNLPLHTINLRSAVTPKVETVTRIAQMYPRLKCFGIMFRECDVLQYLNIFDNFVSVEHINISYSGRQPGVISRILKSCPSVIGLNISGCFWISDEDLICIINEKGNSLRYLQLNGVLFTAKSLSLLTQCTKLKYLSISSSNMSQDKLESIRELTALRSLHLHQAKNISSSFYLDFFNSSTPLNLTELKIFQCRFSDSASLLLTQSCGQLRVLKLKIISEECNGSEEDVHQLNLKLKNFEFEEKENDTDMNNNDLVTQLDTFTPEMFTDTGLAVILFRLKLIRELEIVSVNLTDRYFPRILPSLRRIFHCRVQGGSCLFSWPPLKPKTS